MFHKFNIKTTIGNVLINKVQQDLSGTQLLTNLYQLLGVDASSLASALDGALIPAVFGMRKGKMIVSNKLPDFS